MLRIGWHRPKHPFPAALDDVCASCEWLAQYLKGKYDGSDGRIAIAGESAGGGLAAELCHDHGRSRAFLAVLLVVSVGSRKVAARPNVKSSWSNFPMFPVFPFYIHYLNIYFGGEYLKIPYKLIVVLWCSRQLLVRTRVNFGAVGSCEFMRILDQLPIF